MSYAQPFEGRRGRSGYGRGRVRVKTRSYRPGKAVATRPGWTHATMLAETTGLSGIMDFTGVQAAIDYIKAKVGAFFQLPYEYSQAKKKLPALMAAAKQKGDNTLIAKLSAIDLGVTKLQADYPATESKVKSFLDSLKAAGLGVIPLVLAGVAISVGGLVAFQLVSWGKMKTELNAIEKGLVSEGFFQRPLLGGMGMTLPLLVVGGVGVWWFLGRKRS